MVTLDRLTPDDIPALYAALQDWDVVRWLAVVPWPYRIEDAQEFVTEIADEDIFAIRYHGQLAGVIECGAKMGYWVAKPFWGRGIAKTAARLALCDHFAKGGAPVEVSHATDNHRSRRVIESLGGRDPVPGRMFVRPLGHEVDVLTYRLTATGIPDQDFQRR